MNSKIPSIMRTVTQGQSETSSHFTTPSRYATPSSISEKASSIAQSVKKSVIKDDGGTGIIKILLIISIIAFLVYNIYLYFVEGTDVLGKYFGIGLVSQNGDVVSAKRDIVDAKKVKLTKLQTKNLLARGHSPNEEDKPIQRNESPIERAVDEVKQIEKDRDSIIPDSSFAGNLKKTVKGGYCYIGTDRTFRSCVKVDIGDTCMSNKIFPTKDICVNPNLRA
jgi:hypothetical protein